MEYLENNKIKDFVKNIIENELEDYKGLEVYGCDLAYQLLEEYRVDGVYFYNNYKAINFIKENFEDFGEIVEELKYTFGEENIPNVFEYPDKFCVVCFLEVASYLLCDCKFVSENWNNTFIITDGAISIIKNELKEV